MAVDIHTKNNLHGIDYFPLDFFGRGN